MARHRTLSVMMAGSSLQNIRPDELPHEAQCESSRYKNYDIKKQFWRISETMEPGTSRREWSTGSNCGK
jgi:hypothetical protein